MLRHSSVSAHASAAVSEGHTRGVVLERSPSIVLHRAPGTPPAPEAGTGRVVAGTGMAERALLGQTPERPRLRTGSTRAVHHSLAQPKESPGVLQGRILTRKALGAWLLAEAVGLGADSRSESA